MTTSLSDNSRVWIYQSDREFSESEITLLKESVRNFVKNWTSHSKNVLADFDLRYNRFLILMLDESHVTAGGCSIDSSVHFIKSLEQQFKNTMTDRMKFAFKSGNRVEVVSRNEFEKLMEQGLIGEETIVFNNLIATKKELDSNWEVPLKNSWHKQFFGSRV